MRYFISLFALFLLSSTVISQTTYQVQLNGRTNAILMDPTSAARLDLAAGSYEISASGSASYAPGHDFKNVILRFGVPSGDITRPMAPGESRNYEIRQVGNNPGDYREFWAMLFDWTDLADNTGEIALSVGGEHLQIGGQTNCISTNNPAFQLLTIPAGTYEVMFDGDARTGPGGGYFTEVIINYRGLDGDISDIVEKGVFKTVTVSDEAPNVAAVFLDWSTVSDNAGIGTVTFTPSENSVRTPSIATKPCDSCEFGQPGPAQGFAVQPVACDLTQEATAATISLKIPEGVEVCDVSFAGLIPENWDYKFTTIKADSGFLTVVLANSLGQRIPTGTSTLFNIEYIASRSCNANYYLHWDTALSASAGRRLEFTDVGFQGFVPTFDFGRDSTEILGYRPGDINNDADITIGDISMLIDHLFISGVGLCNLNAADVNGSCGKDATISDVALLIDTLFVSGSVPLQCGCINQGGPLLKSSFAGITLQSTFENGVTTISVNSPVSLRGLQLELRGPENASPVNLVNDKLNQFYGQTGDLVRLGMIDVDGGQTVSAGVTEVVRLAGEYTLVSGVAVDNQLRESAVLLGGDLLTETLPINFGLAQNYPNPFNPVTEIKFSLPVAADVRLEVFNVLGQTVATLVKQRLEVGEHSMTWDATGQASGVYMYRLTAGDFVETKKMILMK